MGSYQDLGQTYSRQQRNAMSKRALFLILTVLCAGCALRLRAQDVLAQQVSVDELDDRDQYYVHGVFETPAPPMEVFKVLSDYEHLGGVLSGLRSSRVLQREDGHLQVEQVLLGKFMFFSKTLRLLLQIDETPPYRIDFTQLGDKPFRHYEGSWQVEPTVAGTRVDYTLSVSRGDTAPVFIERKLFRENSQKLLSELKAEVGRRAALASAAETHVMPLGSTKTAQMSPTPGPQAGL